MLHRKASFSLLFGHQVQTCFHCHTQFVAGRAPGPKPASTPLQRSDAAFSADVEMEQTEFSCFCLVV